MQKKMKQKTAKEFENLTERQKVRLALIKLRKKAALKKNHTAPSEDGEKKESRVLRDRILDLFVQNAVSWPNANLKDIIEEVEKRVILDVLKECQGHQKRAAELLQLKYTTLNVKIKKYKLNGLIQGGDL